jgi:beta-lactamase regulating signal transducer with metallopeptidase domain
MNSAIEWANGLAGHWARGMWPVLWQTAALAAIVGLIVLCNRRMSPALRFWLWMLVPLRLLVMPLIVIALPVLPSPPAVHTEPAVAPTRFISQAPVEAQALELTAQPAPPSIVIQRHVRASIWTWLMAGWFAGIGFFALRLARGWLRMKAVANQARENADARVRDCAREAAAMLGLRKIPRILSAAEGVSPFVLGFFRPVVVLPAMLADHVTPEELRAVLAHEFAHVRRRDALAGWVLACSDVIYFFNPVAHLVKRAIIFERERACDEQVLALAQASRSVYARALLSATGLTRPAAARLSCSPVLLESGQHLERRLKSIADERRPSAALSRKVRLVLLAIALLTLPGVKLTARSATASASSTESLTQAEGINAKVARLNLENATRTDVIAIFGEPASYIWGNKTFTRDNLPDPYIMFYSRAFSVVMLSGQTEEVRFEEKSDYAYHGVLRVGSTLDEAVKVIGPPDRTQEGGTISFEDGVLYKNAEINNEEVHGEKGISYYARRGQGIRIFALRDVVSALYLTRKGPPAAASAERPNETAQPTASVNWTVVPTLDVPDLRPPAVQFAIFDKDPVPVFKTQVSRMRDFNVKQLAEAKDETARGIARCAQMDASWDIGFRDKRGNDVSLLTSGSGIYTTLISNGPAGKKWFVTRAVTLGGKVLCWSIPFEADPHQPVKITLTDENALDLDPIYDEVMSAPAKKPEAPPAAPVKDFSEFSPREKEENPSVGPETLPELKLPAALPDGPQTPAAPVFHIQTCMIKMSPSFEKAKGITGMLGKTISNGEYDKIIQEAKTSAEATICDSPSTTGVSGITAATELSTTGTYVSGYKVEKGIGVPEVSLYTPSRVAFRARATVKGETVLLDNIAAIVTNSQPSECSGDLSIKGERPVTVHWCEVARESYMVAWQEGVRLMPDEAIILEMPGKVERTNSPLRNSVTNIREKNMRAGHVGTQKCYLLVTVGQSLPTGSAPPGAAPAAPAKAPPQELSLRQYDVVDLISSMGGKKLLEMIIDRTGAENWGAVSAAANEKLTILSKSNSDNADRIIYVRGNWLMVNQVDAIHRKIMILLAELRAEMSGVLPNPGIGAASPLDQKINADVLRWVPLREAIRILRTQVEGANFVIDPHVRQDQLRVTLYVKDVTLAQALKAMLEGPKLSFVLSDNVIYISTQEGCAAYMQYVEPVIPEGQAGHLRKLLNTTVGNAGLSQIYLQEQVEILQYLFKDLTITIDPALIAKHVEVTVNVHDVPLRVFLKNMLMPNGLEYTIVGDGIYIKEKAPGAASVPPPPKE